MFNKRLAFLIFLAVIFFIFIPELFSQDIEIQVQLGHAMGVNSALFSPDGRFVLSGSADEIVILWDIASGKEIRRFLGHSDMVNSVVFSHDGRFALSGSNDNTLILWEVTSGREIRKIMGHSDIVTSVAFSADEK